MRTLASIFGRLPLESETLPGVFADSARLCRPGKSACVAASYQKLKERSLTGKRRVSPICRTLSKFAWTKKSSRLP